MNIQNTLRELASEARAEQPHEARQADQIDVVLVQFRRQLPVVHLAIQTLGWQAHGVQPARAQPESSPRPDSKCAGNRPPEYRRSAAALQTAEGSSTPRSRSSPRTPWAACAAYCP